MADDQLLAQVYDALVEGYNGTPIGKTGRKLTAAHHPDDISVVGDEKLPYLLFDVGTLSMSQWAAWEQYATWNIAATLKVKGEPGEVDKVFLRTLGALLLQTRKILGLPIDADGNVVPFSDETAYLFDKEQLSFLIDRSGPEITSLVTQPSDGKYLEAKITFAVQTVLDLDPRQLPIAKVAIMGVNPSPDGIMAPDDTGIPVIADGDQHAVTLGFDSASPVDGQPGEGVAGTPPSQQIRGLNVAPYAASLSVGSPTVQLAAIATFMNWGSRYVTPSAAWTSSDPTVATVNSSGLVTRVAAGSCTVSCSIYGATSNAVAVTCS